MYAPAKNMSVRSSAKNNDGVCRNQAKNMSVRSSAKNNDVSVSESGLH